MNMLKNLFSNGGQSGASNPSSMSVAEAKAAIASDQAPFVLDVRESDEFRSGHIAQAKLIPVGQLGTRMAEVPKDRTILCVCLSGGRSSSAARMLAQSGYTVINMNGGMMAWMSAGFPVKKG